MGAMINGYQQLNCYDPGNKTGWAIFGLTNFGYRLMTCAVSLFDHLPRVGYMNAPATTIIEVPQIYKIEHQKGDPNDLIDVAVKVGQLKERHSGLGPVELVLPRAWKGQLPKPVCWNRALEVLYSEEMSVIQSDSWDMRDAIELGLWRCGRLKLT
jgi:hypothetical protein